MTNPSIEQRPRQGWAECNGISLRYVLTGEGGTPIVLLHEMATNLHSWDLVLPSLAAGGRTILRYDLRGFGLSEKVIDSVSLDDHVADLRALLSALDLAGPVFLIGGALGGTIALATAARHPEMVAGVVALSPAVAAPGADPAEAIARISALENSPMRTLHATGFNDDPESIRNDAARQAFMRSILCAVDMRSWGATARCIATIDLTDELPRIACPALLVAASLYKLRPVEVVERMAARIPDGRFRVLETGHLMPMQSPELVTALIHDFLQEVEPGSNPAARA